MESWTLSLLPKQSHITSSQGKEDTKLNRNVYTSKAEIAEQILTVSDSKERLKISPLAVTNLYYTNLYCTTRICTVLQE